jgi:plasmid stabilization system protein ParE
MSAPRLELHPDAVAEAAGARLWYAARSTAASRAFIRELDRAMDRILESPDLWPEYLHGTRRYLLRRFPFSVVYRCSAAVILVVAIAHAKRKPGYWRRR